jgi:hypothetical protein
LAWHPAQPLLLRIPAIAGDALRYFLRRFEARVHRHLRSESHIGQFPFLVVKGRTERHRHRFFENIFLCFVIQIEAVRAKHRLVLRHDVLHAIRKGLDGHVPGFLKGRTPEKRKLPSAMISAEQ